jgi:transposase
MTEDQVIIGMDPHKSSNTIVVMTPDETMLTRRRFVNSDDGFIEMLGAVADYPNRVWAVEGANGVGRSVAQRLVAFDEVVVDVPAKLATRVRVYSTEHGTKTDNTDAVAIARAAIHSKHLRRVLADDATVAMKLLSDRRHELVGLRTQAMCRLHRLLRELIPAELLVSCPLRRCSSCSTTSHPTILRT